MSFNLLVLAASLCTFEIKSLLNEGVDYFKSFYNQNDMLLLSLSIACLVQEIYILKMDEQVMKFGEEYAIAEQYKYSV
jgi:hypothetical protein